MEIKPENLTAKAKDEFQIWYGETLPELYSHCEPGLPQMPFYVFKALPGILQQGLILAYLRSKNVEPEAFYLSHHDAYVSRIRIMDGDDTYAQSKDSFKDYNLAITAAIKAAFTYLETPPQP